MSENIPVSIRAQKLLESYPEDPCEHCDISVGHVCELCHHLQLVADLLKRVNQIEAVLMRVVAVYDAGHTPGQGLIEELRQVIKKATGE